MNYKKFFHKIILNNLGDNYKLSKSSETFLNLFCFEVIKKIINKCNDLLQPMDYEKQTIETFKKKKLTIREIETSILLLFPKEISEFMIHNCTDMIKKKEKLLFSKSVTENLIRKYTKNNIHISKKSITFLTYINESFIAEILDLSLNSDNINDKVITNKQIFKGIEKDKDLKKILKILKITI